MAERPGVLLRFDVLDALEQLAPVDAGELVIAVLRYGRDGTAPDFKNPVLSVVWPFIRGAVDRDGENYDGKVAQRRYAVYVREAKKRGEIPMSFDDWKVSVDIGDERSMIPDIQSQSQSQSQSQDQDQVQSQEQAQVSVDKPPTLSAVNFGPELNSAFNDWLAYKKEKRQGYKPKGLQSLVTQIEKQVEVYGESAVAALIVECMSNGWQGIIWDKLEKQQPRNGGSGQNVRSARKSWAELARELEEGKHDP